MIRFHAVSNAKAAIAYFSKSDGYYNAGDLRTEWLGKGAEELGLSGKPDFEHFKRLIYGLDPHTGEQLTSKLIHNRIPAWDVTASIPKGVTIALERGDSRIQDALWEAARETLADLEQYATTRVRKGGALDDRLTGNLVAYAVEHPETRPAKADNFPDPDRHLHLVVMNVTRDPVEGEWKAVKFRPIMDLRKFFDRTFDQRLASKLTDLGYGIETKYKAGKYYSWDIKDMPESVVKKFSRRAGEVDKLAKELGVVNPVGKDKLGATSRQFKRTDMTLEDYREYWDSRVSPEEARQVAEVIKGAMEGTNPLPLNSADLAVEFAIDHHFERRSVMKWTDLAITAMERSMGGAKPEEILPEAIRQGVLIGEDSEVSTQHVLAEETKIVDFAEQGRGTCRPLRAEYTASLDPVGQRSPVNEPNSVGSRHSNPDHATLPALAQEKGRPDESKRPLQEVKVAAKPDIATLSPEQQAVSTGSGQVQNTSKLNLSAEQAAMVNHVLTSTDRMVMVIGDAGTGKTFAVKSAFQEIHCPVEILAPGAEASRGVLRREGFSNADTVTSFINSKDRQEAVRNGVIWVDEAGQLPIRDLSQLVSVAYNMNARLVLQGDPKQHRSVARDGNMLNVLQEYAGLPVGRLTDIRRQRGEYKEAVASLAKGDILAGYDKLAEMGWIKQDGLVKDYLTALDANRTALVIAPTHIEGEAITAAIREKLQARGLVSKDEYEFTRLRATGWTDAEKGDRERYDGTEVLCYHRNGGSFKAGDRVRIRDWPVGARMGKPSCFAVYRPESIKLAVGDSIRITANGKTKGGNRIDNGSQYTVDRISPDGDVTLNNGFVLDKSFAHLTHGYVTTSHASQGRTVDRVFIAMGSQSLPAISAEQFYVSVSRGKESARIYSDLPPEQLRDIIQRTDTRKSATELFKPKRRPVSKTRKLIDRIKRTYELLREKVADVTKVRQPEKEMYRGR